MLNSDDIIIAIQQGIDAHSEGIAVIPHPDVDKIAKRGGASIDLRLGRWFQSFRQTRTKSLNIHSLENKVEIETSLTKRHFVPFNSEFVIHPGRFVLGATLEWLRLPSHVAGFVTGKSSLGRRGLIIETASGIHPGFSGCLTLELANVGEVPISITPGMEICQIFLYPLKPSSNITSGKFSGRRRPALGKIDSDEIVQKLRANRPR